MKIDAYEISTQKGADMGGKDMVWIDIFPIEEICDEEGINICEIKHDGTIEYNKNQKYIKYIDDINILRTIIEEVENMVKIGG